MRRALAAAGVFVAVSLAGAQQSADRARRSGTSLLIWAR